MHKQALRLVRGIGAQRDIAGAARRTSRAGSTPGVPKERTFITRNRSRLRAPSTTNKEFSTRRAGSSRRSCRVGGGRRSAANL